MMFRFFLKSILVVKIKSLKSYTTQVLLGFGCKIPNALPVLRKIGLIAFLLLRLIKQEKSQTIFNMELGL